MNILILAGDQAEPENEEESYPLCLTEVDGMPIIQRLLQSFSEDESVRYIVAVPERHIRRYHLDNIVNLLAPKAKVVGVLSQTQGAACTALLATSYIDNDDELLVINGNEVVELDFPAVVTNFRERKLDAGTIVFPSIHPRYSYVRLSASGLIVEAAEKRPISKQATAGFYWFSHGSAFVRAVQAMIRKDASVNDKFYICPSLNELILEQARIGVFPLEPEKYRPLKTANQLMRAELAT